MAAVGHLEFYFFTFLSRDCHRVPNLLLYTKYFIKIWSRVRPPDDHNVQCAVARQRPLPWEPHHGSHVGDTMGCDYPSFIQIGALVSQLWHFQHFPIWRLSTILNFENFHIWSRTFWSRDCHWVPNLLLYTKFYQNWITRSASRWSLGLQFTHTHTLSV